MYQIKTTGPLHNALTPVITGRDSEQVLPVFTNWKRTSQFKTPRRWYSGCRPLQQIVAQQCSGWLHLSLLGGYAESGDCSNDAASLLFSGMSLGAWGSWSFFQRWQMLQESPAVGELTWQPQSTCGLQARDLWLMLWHQKAAAVWLYPWYPLRHLEVVPDAR